METHSDGDQYSAVHSYHVVDYSSSPWQQKRAGLPTASLCFRRRQRLPRAIVVIAMVFVVLTLRSLYYKEPPDEKAILEDYVGGGLLGTEISMSPGSRHLLGNDPSDRGNCTPPAIEHFPTMLFTPHQRAHGAVIVHILVAAYMFLALAVACDDYFVPACEKICELLKLSDDVAGATFMAAGSSAPELATACIGVFIAKDDIGLGAVVGSAVFNIMFVIGVCALFAGSVVYLKWWPLIRDCLYYTISILALVLVIYDESVHWYEAMILLLLYVLYIVLMYFNPRIEAKVTPIGNRWFCRDQDNTDAILLKNADVANHNTFSDSDRNDTSESDEETEIHSLLPSSVREENGNIKKIQNGEIKVLDPSKTKDGDDSHDSPSVLTFPSGHTNRALWVMGLPLIVVMFVTVPDCRRTRWSRWYPVTFCMSIVWIGIFSYVMVWMITVAGYTFHIPDTVMGLTFIAAGSSVPDAIASLLVCRDGYGDMAVSNAVGSNVFDILLCLGLPWLIQSLAVNPLQPIQVYSEGLTYSALTLLLTVVFLIAATHLNRWRLTPRYGVVLMVVYFLFNALASMYELNLFGYVRPPTCASDF